MHFINYIALIGKRREITPLYIPDNIHHELLRWLCGFPHTIEHYIYGYGLYNMVINLGERAGVKVTFVYEDSYKDIIENDRFKTLHSGLKVFLDCTVTADETQFMRNFFDSYIDDGQSVLLSFNGFPDIQIPLVKSREQYLEYLDRYCQTNFLALMAEKSSPHELSSEFDRGMLFSPTNCNTLTLHAAAGDFAFEIASVTDDERRNESYEAILQHKTFNRQDKLIRQLGQFDKLESHFLTTADLAPWMLSQRKSPLIISMPYNSSDLAAVIDKSKADDEFKPIRRVLKKLFTIGQTSNYTVDRINDGKTDSRLFVDLMQECLFPRSRFLDIVSSFHASRRFSPSLRLPMVGNEINYYLSRVAPGVIHRLYDSRKKKKSLIQAFKEIGIQLSRRELSEAARNYISGCERQVVAITDLPVEWMDINGVPLGFSHDVCRMPEVPYAAALQNYVISQFPHRFVGKDIISRTMVVFGSDDECFIPFQKKVAEQSEKSGYKIIRPKTVEELRLAVESERPQFLIFDTHGGYDKDSHESYLHIGDERLYPEAVAATHISAPLIFMSACSTAPVYNLTKTVANAFIGEGAIAVTAAYMPLPVLESSVTYMRVLRLLEEASTKMIHKNWLSFISHVLRTSSIHESFVEHHLDSKGGNPDILKVQSQQILESIPFSSRREVFRSLLKGISVGGERITSENHIPNYLMYTTIGRADLVDFEVYHETLSKSVETQRETE